MAEKPSIKGFLRGVLGLGKGPAEPIKPAPAPESPGLTAFPTATPAQGAGSPLEPVQPGPGPRPFDMAQGKLEASPDAKTLGDKPAQTPQPPSEAYLNRRKGRRRYSETPNYWKHIADCLERGGEVAPGDMARELGIPKSTLIYNLNRLLTLSQADPNVWRSQASEESRAMALLGSKRLERVGGGKYVRYRLMASPKPQDPREPGPGATP